MKSPLPLQKLIDAKWLSRLRQDRSVRDALFVFLLTRILVFLIFIFVGSLRVDTIPNTPTPVREAFISFERVSIARQLRDTMWRADVAHYMDIARDGYLHAPFDVENAQSRKFAFFPLHPLLLWLLGHVTKDVMLAGAALANFCFFLALVFLHKLTLAFGYDESTARRAIFYIAAFPVSYFFSVPLTESLFLLLTVASFYAAKREHWWAAGAIGMLAAATRVNGVLLVPALLVLSWQMYRSFPARKFLGVLLIPVGLFAYMLYSWYLSGNALAFSDAVRHWGRKPAFFLSGLFKYAIHPHQVLEPWNPNLLNFASAILCFVAIYILLKRREWTLAFYAAVSIVLPLSSGILQSLDRYTLAFFPVFMALAIAARTERMDQAIRFVFVILLGIMTALFAANYSAAVT
ncbi:MAG TPA: mannosyltransferase family protein [Pyrinomonadaceae bacterium]|nr:mannosyltransferase family protein [Pyrinomonadaceae bacterium]